MLELVSGSWLVLCSKLECWLIVQEPRSREAKYSVLESEFLES
jgi:hypothetical protein